MQRRKLYWIFKLGLKTSLIYSYFLLQMIGTVQCNFILYSFILKNKIFCFFFFLFGVFFFATFNNLKVLDLFSVQFSLSVVSDSMNHSTPGLPLHHQLPESTPNPCPVGDAIPPSHPLSSPPLPDLNLSQHQGLFFPSGGQSIGVSTSTSVLPMNTQD